MGMHLRKELVVSALLASSIVGCRSKAYESMHSATTAPDIKMPYKGDPYTFGGIQDSTGGLIAATRSSMETETYTDPKFKKLAGPDSFVSMTGHSLSKAKPSDTKGDYQPLPSEEHHDSSAPESTGTEAGH